MKSEATFVISPQHPALPGHFPGKPIVPGALLLDEALYAIEAAGHPSMATCTIAWVKFRGIVGPGEAITLRFEQRANRSIMFVIRTADRIVADGVMTLPFNAADALDEP